MTDVRAAILDALKKQTSCEVTAPFMGSAFEASEDLQRFCDEHNLLIERIEEEVTRFVQAMAYSLREIVAYMQSQISTENLAIVMEGVTLHDHHLRLRELKTLHYRLANDCQTRALVFLEGERQVRVHPFLLPDLNERMTKAGFALEEML